ncbi:hypothetical protein L596_020399 [Steinernema carpocapsae]|uniref:Uncharacterized protein n=1 Tax=Steinernema carpocapsae TaxID=34508 RepID=A0A4V6A119_STECR|nr:hypothetical protein L596_020399 [Steinernema carpocapsae]
MARNGFRTAKYGKVRIREKGDFYTSLSGPDAITLHKPQSATMKTEECGLWSNFLCSSRCGDAFNQKSTQSPTRNFTIAKKNDNFDRRKIANPIPS